MSLYSRELMARTMKCEQITWLTTKHEDFCHICQNTDICPNSHFLDNKQSTLRYPTLIHLCGFLIGTLWNDYHQHILSGWMLPTTPLLKKKKRKKKNQSYAWEEGDKGSQTGRRERQNLIKFNKAERIAQAVNSDSAFFFFLYNFCLLKHFYTPSFYLCLHSLKEE